MDDCIIEVIDTVISDEEIVNNWDTKVGRKIATKLSVCENETVLDEVLRDYVWILQNQALNFKMKKLLKEKIISHLKVFHLCCITTSNLPTELQSYWENMENVLIILCNLELDVIRHLKLNIVKDYKERIVEVTTKLIYVLSVFLLRNNMRICHVLLKLNVRYDSRSWKDVMKVIYRHFLVMVPVKDKSEENFCRNHILFQNYKKLVNKEHHDKMDSVLYERFNMDPDIVNRSKTLKNILSPAYSNVVDLVDVLGNGKGDVITNYFNHIDKKSKDDDDNISFSINLESDSEDEVCVTSGNKTIETRIGEIKIEDIVEETRSYYDNAHVICVDDDSDVEEISLPITSKSSAKAPSPGRPEIYVSFLDSIQLPGEDTLNEPSTLTASSIPAEDEPTSPSHSISLSPLPFIELYLENLKSKGQVLGTNVSDATVSNTIDSSDVSVEKSFESNVENENLLAEKISETSNLLLPTLEQESSEVVINSEQFDNTQIEQTTVESESLKTTEKPLELPTSTDDFNFISGLITPPISDRTNDDVAPDLNHVNNGPKNVYVPNMITMDDISYHYEPEMEISINNNCNTVTSGLVTDSCAVEEAIFDEHVETEVVNTGLSTDSQENVDIRVEEHLELRESLDREDSDRENCSTPEMEESEITTLLEQSHTDINVENNTEPLSESQDHLNLGESLSPNDMVLDDYQLPIPEIREVLEDQVSISKNTSEETLRQNTEKTDKEDESSDFNKIVEPIKFSKNSSFNSISKLLSDVVTESKDQESRLENLTAESEDGESTLEYLAYGTEDQESRLESMSPVDMVLDDTQLPTAEIRETVLNTPVSSSMSEIVINYEPNLTQKLQKPEPAHYSSVNKMVEAIDSSRNSSYKGVCKIQASVSMGEAIYGMNTPKLNRDTINKVFKTKPSRVEYFPEKVIYTSSERVTAPLSLFSKFEQAQSELVENAFSGPIEPIYSYSNLHSDHSNDSLHSFQYARPQSKVKTTSVSTANSPLSPPYEQIQAQEYENHIMSVDYNHLINTISTPLHRSKTIEANCNVQNTKPLKAPSDINNSRKRKLGVRVNQNKKSKVNFGPTEVRIIPRDDSQRIDDVFLREAWESMKKFKIGAYDAKLVYLQPRIPVKIETISELQEKEQQLKIRGLLYNAPGRTNASSNSCILKRVDYKKMAKQMEHSVNSSERNFGHKISNLISKPVISTRIEPVPSGYIPPINGYSSGFRYNYESMVSNTSMDTKYQSDVRSKVVTKNIQPAGVRTVPKRLRGRPKKNLDPSFKFSTKGTT